MCIFSTSCFNKSIKKYNTNFAPPPKKKEYIRLSSNNKTLNARLLARVITTGARGTDHPLFLTFCLQIYVLHLISIMSFKLGHVSIPKRQIFLSLFLFCAYDSSVLQNFKIFTHLLPNFSYKDSRLTEVTYLCINFNDRVRNIPNI